MRGKFGGGTGTLESPYIVQDAEDFAKINASDAVFKLDRNIKILGTTPLESGFFQRGTIILNGFEVDWTFKEKSSYGWYGAFFMGTVVGGRIVFRRCQEEQIVFMRSNIAHCELVFPDSSYTGITLFPEATFNFCKIQFINNTQYITKFSPTNRNFYNTIIQTPYSFSSLSSFLRDDPDNKAQAKIVCQSGATGVAKLPGYKPTDTITWEQPYEFWRNQDLWWRWIESYFFQVDTRKFVYNFTTKELVESTTPMAKFELNNLTEDDWNKIKQTPNIKLIQHSNLNGKRFDLITLMGTKDIGTYTTYATNESTLAVI